MVERIDGLIGEESAYGIIYTGELNGKPVIYKVSFIRPDFIDNGSIYVFLKNNTKRYTVHLNKGSGNWMQEKNIMNKLKPIRKYIPTIYGFRLLSTTEEKKNFDKIIPEEIKLNSFLLSNPHIKLGITVMERIQNPITLRKILEFTSNDELKDFSKLSPGLQNILRQLCMAIAELHGIGINHMDLHPGNILINQDTQKVYLIDWGQSKARFKNDIHNPLPERKLDYYSALIEGCVKGLKGHEITDIIRDKWMRNQLQIPAYNHYIKDDWIFRFGLIRDKKVKLHWDQGKQKFYYNK